MPYIWWSDACPSFGESNILQIRSDTGDDMADLAVVGSRNFDGKVLFLSSLKWVSFRSDQIFILNSSRCNQRKFRWSSSETCDRIYMCFQRSSWSLSGRRMFLGSICFHFPKTRLLYVPLDTVTLFKLEYDPFITTFIAHSRLESSNSEHPRSHSCVSVLDIPHCSRLTILFSSSSSWRSRLTKKKVNRRVVFFSGKCSSELYVSSVYCISDCQACRRLYCQVDHPRVRCLFLAEVGKRTSVSTNTLFKLLLLGLNYQYTFFGRTVPWCRKSLLPTLCLFGGWHS